MDEAIQRAAGAASAGDPLDAWPAFANAVRARLDQGQRTYGDASFHRDPAELLGELAQEALDLAGWGFVLWRRVQLLAAEAAEMKRERCDE